MTSCTTKTELYNAVQNALNALPISKDFLTDLSDQGKGYRKAKTQKHHSDFEGKSLLDLVSSVANKNLQSIATLPAEVFSNPKVLTQALIDMGLDKKFAKDLADTYRDFEKQLVFAKSKKTSEFYPISSPLKLFETEELDYLPPAAVFSMMIAGLDWVSTSNQGRALDSDFLRGLFLYGDAAKSLTIDELNQLENIEYTHLNEANRVGTNVLRILQLRPKNDEAKYVYDRLGVALGAMTFVVLDQLDFLDVRTHTFQFEKKSEGRKFNTGDKLNVININPELDTRDFGNIAKGIRQYSNNLTGGTSLDVDRPLQEPSNIVPSHIPDSLGGVPKRLQKLLKKLQSIIWTTTDSFDRTKELYSSHPETIKKLMGVVEINKFDHVTYRESAKASNKDKLDALNNLFSFSDEGLLDRFFLTYSLMNQHRIMQKGKVNPQASHVTRNLVRSHGVATYDKGNIQWFQLTVLFNLGVGVDKLVAHGVTKTFESYVQNEAIINTVKAFKNGDNDRSAHYLNELIEQDLAGDLSTIAAIEALVKYDEFLETGKSFKSDIKLEIDGISNGFAIGVLQFPTFKNPDDLVKFLNQTGTYFGDTSKHLEDGIYAERKVPDVYLELGGKTVTYSELEYYLEYHDPYGNLSVIEKEDVKNNYIIQERALTELFPALSGQVRDLVKYPYIIYNYGGSIGLIALEIADQIILDIFKDLGKLQIEKVTAEKNKENLTEVFEKAVKVQNNLKQLGVKINVPKLLRLNKLSEHLLESEEYSSLHNTITEILEPRFKYALEEMLGDFAATRKGVVEAAQLLQAMFQVKLDNYQVEFQKETGRQPSTREVQTYIKENLLQWIPHYKGPWTDTNTFIDLTTQEVVKEANAADASERIDIQFTDENGNSKSRSVTKYKKQYTFPGVKPIIRMIQNMDAAINAAVLEKFSNVLTLYDAFLGNPLEMDNIHKLYGETYLKYSENFGFLETLQEQVHRNFNLLSEEEVKQLNQIITKEINSKKERKAFYPHKALRRIFKPELRIQFFIDRMDEKANEAIQARKDLFNKFKEEGVVSHQLYVPDMNSENSEENIQVMTEEEESYLRNHHKAVIGEIQDWLVNQKINANAQLKEIIKSRGVEYLVDMFDTVDITKFGKDYISIAREKTIIKNLLAKIEKQYPAEDAVAILAGALGQTGDHVADLVDGLYQSRVLNSTQLNKAKLNLAKWFNHPVDFVARTTLITEEGDITIEDVKDILKSLDLDKRNVVETNRGEISLSNIENIFEAFVSKSADHYASDSANTAHQEHLRKVFNILKPALTSLDGVTLSVETIDGLTQGDMNLDTGVLTVSLSRQPVASVVGQSPQEVFMHEFLHAITDAVIKNDPTIANEIRKVRTQTKREINKAGKYKVFLRGIDNPSTEDIELAKQQYNYLFDNPKNTENELSEFLAYGLTNQAMISFLSSIEAKLPNRDTSTLLGRLQHIWDVVIDKLLRSIRNAVGNNSYEDLFQLTKQLVAIQRNQQTTLNTTLTKAGEYTDTANDKIRDLTKKGANYSLKLLKNPKNIASRTISTGIKGVTVAMSNNDQVNHAMTVASSKISRFATDIYLEIAGGALTNELVDQLLRVNHFIGKNRQIVEEETTGWFNKTWKSDFQITKQIKEDLTTVYLRTDLSSLLNLGIPITDIFDYIRSPKLLANKQKSLLRILGISKGNRIVTYADELANYMVTGDTYLHNGHHNAYSILKEFSKEFSRDQRIYLDAYITLEALKRTSEKAKINVLKLIDAEMVTNNASNGAIDLLKDHLQYVNRAKVNLFNNNPMLMQKGYIIERVDNLHDIQIGTESDIPFMEKARYKEHYPIGEIHGVTSLQNKYIFVSRHMPEVGYVGGILSMTSRKSKGTTMKSILEDSSAYKNADGSVDYKRIYKEIRKYTAASKRAAMQGKRKSTTKKLMRPIRDENGKIVDYRVQMNHARKKELLNPDLEYQDVMAHMKSNYVDKLQTPRMNQETILLLVNEWEKIGPQKPELFVNILEDEYFAKYYVQLPPDTKRYLDQFIVDGKFMVRAAILDKVFGFRKKQLSNLKFFDKKERARLKYWTHFTQYLFEQTISKGLERVIIATFDVVFGNLMSNNFNLMMRGISPAYIARKMYEGYQEYRRLDKDIRESRELKRQITMYNLPSNSTEYKRFATLQKRIDTNAFAEINRRGLNTLIVEDVNEANKDGYYSRLLDYLGNKELAKKVPKSITNVAHVLYMSRATQPFRVMKHVVTVSDLLARYVLIEHLTTKKEVDKETAIHEAIEAFVLYDENINPNLQVLNDLGFTAFIKYWLRNQRSVKTLIKRNPLNVLGSAGIHHTLEIDTLANVESSFYGLDFSPTVMYQDDLLDHVTDLTLLENLGILEE